MADDDKTLRRATRIYEFLLCLYPRAHRREYGALMRQLFRDQCRDAHRDGARWPMLRLWVRTSRDLIFTTIPEHLNEIINRIKTMRPNTLALTLFIIALASSLATGSVGQSNPGAAATLAYVSCLALLVRAIVEWVRPVEQLVRSLTWGAVIAVLWALFMPMWAKLKLPLIAPLVMIPIFLNAIVPLVRTVLHLTTRRTPPPSR